MWTVKDDGVVIEMGETEPWGLVIYAPLGKYCFICTFVFQEDE